jgi:hypothetical protein
MDQKTFDAMYTAAQPPEVRALMAIQDQTQKEGRAVELAVKGFVIDKAIMVWGMDPYDTMRLRQDYGYTWVPSLLVGPVQLAPGLTVPNMMPYDPAHPPAGAIKVSLDPADYKPFDPPKPAAPVASVVSPVGGLNYANIYFSTPGDAEPDGEIVSETRGMFKKHRVVGPWGPSQFWEKIS